MHMRVTEDTRWEKHEKKVFLFSSRAAALISHVLQLSHMRG